MSDQRAGKPKRERYHALAKTLLASDNPVKAIAELIGDHEGRLDAIAERVQAIEARTKALNGRANAE